MKAFPRIALIALAAVALGTAALAAPDRPNRLPGFIGGEIGNVLMRATRELNLSDAQQQTIRDLVKNARQQRSTQSLDITVIGDPGNPNYAAAIETAKSQAAQRVQAASDLQHQIYNVLTPAQKTQLPSVLADIKTKMAARRAERQQKQNQPAQ